jgi:N-acetylglucosaminyl-diphospho-decaprenol L-rhamnosyltransferase
MSVSASIAVVIVNYRTPHLVFRCLEALRLERGSGRDCFAFVVDGGSADGSAEMVSKYVAESRMEDWVKVMPFHMNGGFGWANNQAIRAILKDPDPPSLIHLLNPDAVVKPGSVHRLARAIIDDPAVAAAGSRLLSEDGRILGSAFRFPSLASEFARGAATGPIERALRIRPLRVDPKNIAAVDWVTGASVMLRTAALRNVGLFDEGFFLYFEEMELMYRIRQAGWKVIHVPDSQVVHEGGAATGLRSNSGPVRLPDYWFRSRLRFFARTRGFAGTVAVNLAWLVGRSISGARALLFGGVNVTHPSREISDFLRLGFWPRRHDLLPHGTHLLAPESTPPAWMSR